MCMAHARMKIHDVHVRIPSALAEEALGQLSQLYAIEADIRGMPAKQRLAERQRKTKPLLKSLESKRLVRTVLIFTEKSDQLSRVTDRVSGLPASPGYAQ